MAKQIYAVTNINHSGKWYDAGSELKADDFSKEELRQLYDNGAIEIRDSSTVEEMVKPEEPAPWEEEVSTPKPPVSEPTPGPDTTVTSPEKMPSEKAVPAKVAPAKAAGAK